MIKSKADHLTHTPRETLGAHLYASGKKVTYVGMVVNALLIVLKFIGGILGTSSALIADGFHSFSDFITDIGVLVGLKYLAKPADTDHAYGKSDRLHKCRFPYNWRSITPGPECPRDRCGTDWKCDRETESRGEITEKRRKVSKSFQ